MNKVCSFRLTFIVFSMIFLHVSVHGTSRARVKRTTAIMTTSSRHYRFWGNIKLSYHEATGFCASNMMAVPQFNDQQEYNEFLTELKTQRINSPYWIGLIRDGPSFIWETNGKQLNFRGWFDGEPSNGTLDNCVVVNTRIYNNTFFAHNCRERNSVVCYRDNKPQKKMENKEENHHNNCQPKPVEANRFPIVPVLIVTNVMAIFVIILLVVSFVRLVKKKTEEHEYESID